MTNDKQREFSRGESAGEIDERGTPRGRLKELLKNAPRNTRAFYDQYADYLLANGVIVPPCKVGDPVYWVDDGKIKCEEVFEISIHIDGILIHTKIQFCLKPDAVFLTKEEAEKALGGVQG